MFFFFYIALLIHGFLNWFQMKTSQFVYTIEANDQIIFPTNFYFNKDIYVLKEANIILIL